MFYTSKPTRMKNIYRKIYFLIVISILGVATSRSQDIHFSQFWMTPLNLNPAQAGAQYDIRGIVNYKNQWSSVTEPFTTFNGSYDMRLGKKKDKGFSGIGLNFFQDNTGDSKMKTFQVNLNYAYHIMLGEKSTLGGGLYAGYMQRSITYAGLQWMNQYDGKSYNSALSSGEPAAGNSLGLFDCGGGIHYEYGTGEKYITGNDQKNISAGLSVFHINRPDYSFYGNPEKLEMKTTGYVNANIGIPNSSLSVLPGILYLNQGSASELLVGTMFKYKLKEESKYTGYLKGGAIALGGYYRNKDAYIASMLLEIAQYAIGISYDVNVSGLSSASNGRGGIELSLRFVSPSSFLYKNMSRF